MTCVLLDSSVSDVSVTANNLDFSIVTNSDLTKPNEDFRKEIKDDVVIESNDENEVIDNTGLMGFAEANDVVIESNDENEVIDNTGLMGFAEASNENVNAKRIELRVCERDNNSKYVCIFYESCKEKMQDSSEIQEEKVYEDEEAAVNREQIALGRLIHGDDDMKVNTSENVVSEFMVVKIDKFEGCVNGDERDYDPERNNGSLAEQHKRNVCENSVSICSPYTNTKKAGEGYQNFTCGRESDKKMGDLSESSLIVDLEVAKINEDSLGHLKFDVWKWPKKRRKGAKCKVKKRGWKFDF
nr:hypothetical protein [Tanacetum cinerariifolium]